MNIVLSKPVDLNMIHDLIAKYVHHSAALPESMLCKSPADETLFTLADYPLLDINLALMNIGKESLLSEMLLLLIKQEIPEDVTALKIAYIEENLEMIEKIVHKLKSGAIYCGTVRMRYACQYFERYQKAGFNTFLKKLYHQLLEVIEETNSFIQKWLENQASL